MSFNFEEFLKKHYVHPETIAFFVARAAENPKPYYEVGVEEARKTSLHVCTTYSGPVNFVGDETEVTIPSPDVPEGLPATVYRPSGCDSQQAPPIVIYFHGGGNTVGSRKTHEATCKIIASQVPCIFVNVEYRLAPEHKYPANIDDAVVSTKWVSENKEALGGASGSKLGVSGDSAGARLAAVACHEVKDAVNFQVLVYPAVSMVDEYPSFKEFEDGPVLSKPIREWFMAQYGIPDSERTSPRASVIKNQDFSYLPPTLIVVADLDPLRDGCNAYYDKLKEAGVNVEIKTIKGVPHAFWNLPAYYEKLKTAGVDVEIKTIKGVPHSFWKLPAYYDKLKEAGIDVEIKTIKGVPHSFWNKPGAFPENCKEAYSTTTDFIRKTCGL